MEEHNEVQSKKVGFKTIFLIGCLILLTLPIFALLGQLLLPDFSHKGIERYTENKCLKCENGTDFFAIVDSFGLEQAGEIVNFTHQYDTFITVNCYEDIYILDIECGEEKFEDIESYALSCLTYERQQMIPVFKGSFYLVLMDIPGSGEYVILAFNSTDLVVRCIYIAGCDSKDTSALTQIIVNELNCVEWGPATYSPVKDKDFQRYEDNSIVPYGLLGINPFKIDNVLAGYGINSVPVKLEDLSLKGTYFIMYWNGSPFLSSAHCVAVHYDGEFYATYNLDGDGYTSPDSPYQYAENYICGYRVS